MRKIALIAAAAAAAASQVSQQTPPKPKPLERRLFIWTTTATTGYFCGIVAVAAPTVEEAREIIAADLDRWLKFGEEEGSPCWFNFDQKTGETFDEAWDEKDQAEVEAKKEELLSDISDDPLVLSELGVFWRGGGS